MGVIQRKRINNDIYTRLTVLDSSGSPIDIEGALSYNVVARPHSSNGEYPVLTTANGNLIDVYFLASKQKEIGTYDFKLTFTKNDPSVLGGIATFTIDFCDAFELLPKTCHDSELQLGSDNIQGIISSINYSMMSPTERDDLAQRIATKNGTDQLSELLDVDLDNLSISDTIVFNGTHWVNTPFVGSGGSNNATWGNEVNNTISVTINGVQKVLSLSSHSHSWSSITNKPLTDNQFTSLLSLASQWEVDGNGDLFTNKNVTVNGTITATTFAGISQGGVGALNLSELLDVELTSPEENDVLVFEDSQWINKPLPEVVSDITWDGTDGDIGIIDISGTKYRFALEGHTHFINEIDAYHEGTLDSYNITDAYTKDQIDSLLGIGGSGNVHSIGILVPEGFTISNSVIVNRGVFNIGFEDGYELSTKLWHTRWKKAYNDSHIHGNMDVLNDLTPSLVAKWNLLATHLDDYDNPHKTRFVDLLEKPNSLSGYGITNAYTKREIDRMFNTSGGGGSGTISSIGLQVPQGLRVLNSPLTSNGDLIIGLEPGYEIPLANNVGGHTHGNLPVLEQLTQANIDVLSLLSIDAGNLRISTNAYSTGGLSAYGMGSGSGSGSGGNIDIEDNLVSTRADAALSANMGRVLKDMIDNFNPGGSGSVTSVGLSAPTGFSVSGSPVTSSGTLALSFASGYSLPTTAKQNNWDSKAAGNHNHSGVYEPVISSGNSTQYWRGDKTWQTLNKAAVGLGNVTNESKETMFTNAALTGNPIAPTQILGNNSTRIATTAFVQNSLLNNDLFERVLIDGSYYIKAKYGLFSVGGLSAYGNGTGGGGGGSNVSMILTDANSVALTVEGVTANLSRTGHTHSNMVTTNTTQTIRGSKTFSSAVTMNGNLTAGGSITASGFFQSSDIRLKNVIKPLKINIKDILNIPSFYFTYKDKDNKRINIGTSAQEVQKVFPEIVNENLEGMLSVEYDKFGLIALELIKTQQKEIDSLKYKLNNLNDKLNGRTK